MPPVRLPLLGRESVIVSESAAVKSRYGDTTQHGRDASMGLIESVEASHQSQESSQT